MQESKVSKSSNSNSTSTAGDHEKGFSLLRLDTIQLWAWLEGHQPLDDLSLKSLSEDVSYRIRETTDVNTFLQYYTIFAMFCNQCAKYSSECNQLYASL